MRIKHATLSLLVDGEWIAWKCGPILELKALFAEIVSSGGAYPLTARKTGQADAILYMDTKGCEKHVDFVESKKQDAIKAEARAQAEAKAKAQAEAEAAKASEVSEPKAAADSDGAAEASEDEPEAVEESAGEGEAAADVDEGEPGEGEKFFTE